MSIFRRKSKVKYIGGSVADRDWPEIDDPKDDPSEDIKFLPNASDDSSVCGQVTLVRPRTDTQPPTRARTAWNKNISRRPGSTLSVVPEETEDEQVQHNRQVQSTPCLSEPDTDEKINSTSDVFSAKTTPPIDSGEPSSRSGGSPRFKGIGASSDKPGEKAASPPIRIFIDLMTITQIQLNQTLPAGSSITTMPKNKDTSVTTSKGQRRSINQTKNTSGTKSRKDSKGSGSPHRLKKIHTSPGKLCDEKGDASPRSLSSNTRSSTSIGSDDNGKDARLGLDSLALDEMCIRDHNDIKNTSTSIGEEDVFEKEEAEVTNMVNDNRSINVIRENEAVSADKKRHLLDIVLDEETLCDNTNKELNYVELPETPLSVCSDSHCQMFSSDEGNMVHDGETVSLQAESTTKDVSVPDAGSSRKISDIGDSDVVPVSPSETISSDSSTISNIDCRNTGGGDATFNSRQKKKTSRGSHLNESPAPLKLSDILQRQSSFSCHEEALREQKPIKTNSTSGQDNSTSVRTRKNGTVMTKVDNSMSKSQSTDTSTKVTSSKKESTESNQTATKPKTTSRPPSAAKREKSSLSGIPIVDYKKLSRYLRLVRDHPREYMIVNQAIGRNPDKPGLNHMIQMGKVFRKSSSNFIPQGDILSQAVNELGHRQVKNFCTSNGSQVASSQFSETKDAFSQLEQARIDVEQWYDKLSTSDAMRAKEAALKDVRKDDPKAASKPDELYHDFKYCKYLRFPNDQTSEQMW